MALKHLHRMAIFAKVVEKGSFSGAASTLGLGKSAVSQHVSALENELEVKLLNRNTRSLTLTCEGRSYYEACARIVAEAERAEEVLDSARASEKGQVRMTCSYNLGLNFVIPALVDFRRQYCCIEIDLLLEDRVLNMVEEGLDLSLRSGWLADSSLYSMTLAPMRMIICASPAYLARHGTPVRLDDLIRHDWVAITSVFHPGRVTLESVSGERATTGVRTVFRVNSGYAARQLILSGVGIGILPDYAVTGALAKGALMRVCAEWASKTGAVSAVFPSKDHQSRRSRLLIEFLKARLTGQLRQLGQSVAIAPQEVLPCPA